MTIRRDPGTAAAALLLPMRRLRAPFRGRSPSLLGRRSLLLGPESTLRKRCRLL